MEENRKSYKKRKICRTLAPKSPNRNCFDAPLPKKPPISIRNVSSTGKKSQTSFTSTNYYGLSDIQSEDVLLEDVPDTISVSYVNDFNLIKVHETILRKLRAETNKIPKLRLQLKRELSVIQSPQTIIERNKSIRKIKKIQNEIKVIRQESRIRDYLEKAKPYIEEYKRLVPQKRKIDFTSKKEKVLDEEEEKDPKYRRKILLVDRYLRIAKNYIKVNVEQKKRNVNKCVCGFDLTDIPIDNFGTQICPECETERYIVGFNLHKTDTLATRNDYSDRDNFEKALMRYQGKQVDKIPDGLFNDLDKYFSSRGKPGSDEIKSRSIDSRGRKRGTNLAMLYKALLDTGYSSLYEDANLIAHRYWGWKLPDVTHLESIIMEDYEKTQRIYNMLQKQRSSSLGTQFRLFKHLELRGYPCSIGDFKVVKMRESIERHNEMWKEMCDGCDDPEIYFIPTI